MKRFGRTLVVVGIVAAVAAAAAAAAWAFLLGRGDDGGRLVLLGNVDVRQVDLGFKVGGRIAAMAAEEGDAAAAGQVLAALDAGYMEDEARLARARLAAQEAAVERLENGTRPEEVDQARALVAERRAALDLARATLDRQQELAERGVAAHQLHDAAEAAGGQAEAQLRAAEQALRLAEIGPRREDVAAARAQREAERAALAQAERRLADTVLAAPGAGTVLTRVREVGAVVAAGETVYTLSLAAPVWVRTYVDEPDLNRVQPGMAAEVTIDSVPGKVYRGQVGFVSPVAEFTPKTVETRELRTSLVYRLRVVVAEPDAMLRQGMPVTVALLRPAPGA